MLGITYKAAWFMAHRIREAMTKVTPPVLGGAGQIVETDEIYHGKREIPIVSPNRRGAPYFKPGKHTEKRGVIGLVKRDGQAVAVHLRGRVTSKNAVLCITCQHAPIAQPLLQRTGIATSWAAFE